MVELVPQHRGELAAGASRHQKYSQNANPAKRFFSCLSEKNKNKRKQKNQQHSRHGDARLADHLRAQVFSRQLEGPVQQPEVLEEAVVGGSPRHQQRADLLEL